MMAAIFAAGFLAAPRAGLAQGPDEILAEVQKKHSNMESMRANYVRVTTTKGMEGIFQSTSKHTASGMLMFKKPAKLSLDQSQPRTEKMVTNGRSVWWYIPEENQVHLYPEVDVYTELKPLLDFFNGLSVLEGQYMITVIPAGTEGEKDHRLDMTRMKKRPGTSDMTVWVKPGTYELVGFQQVSLTGDITHFTLTEVELNPNLQDGIFNFRVPAGVEVIEEKGDK